MNSNWPSDFRAEIVGIINADLYIGSEIHDPMKLAENDRDDVFEAVFNEIEAQACSQSI